MNEIGNNNNNNRRRSLEAYHQPARRAAEVPTTAHEGQSWMQSSIRSYSEMENSPKSKTVQHPSSNSEDGVPKTPCERSRYDTSLGLLTRRFAELLKQSSNGELDLNLVAHELNAPKRRVYDVTNVLEGVQLIRKTSKSHIQWLGDQENQEDHLELKALKEQEQKLDQLVQSCTWQVHQMCMNLQCQRFAYLTFEDLRRIPSLEEQTVIVIKAPAETKLEVPHPDQSHQVHLSSTQGPIEVFLCSDDTQPLEAPAGCGDSDLCVSDDRSAAFCPHPSSVQLSNQDWALQTAGSRTV